MIIKELRIGSFAGIENRNISFSERINIIYGENEAGKSRIENFIKAMLYGLSNRKVKGDSERKKYISFNKETAYGEMVVAHEGKCYLIKRRFGTTKKQDVSEIFDFYTGDKIEDVNTDEPGRYFLNINKSTFEKTLYIGQLSVSFSKDKEEEIMDKVTAALGCGDNEVSGEKAMTKLENLKKSYVTSRGTGSLDLLNKKLLNLKEERYEVKKIAEDSLQWQKELVDKEEQKVRISSEISNLEIYKKYIKKVKLQKEYKDIVNYFKESEELKEEERKLNENLSKDGNIIEEEFLDEILEVNNEYLGRLDEKREEDELLKYYKSALDNKKSELEKYKFVDLFDDNLKNRLLEIKYEQQNLYEKIRLCEEIEESIKRDEEEFDSKKNMFDSKYDKGFIEEIIKNLNLYEMKLKQLREIADEEDDRDLLRKRNNVQFTFIIGILIFILGCIIAFIKGVPFMASVILIIMGAIIAYMIMVKKGRAKSSFTNEVDKLTDEIGEIESKISKYREKLNLENNENLIRYIRKYNMFEEYSGKIAIRIEEKKKILNNNNYNESYKKYQKNSEMIKSLIRISDCKNINEVLNAIDEYEKIKSELETINEKIFKVENNIGKIKDDILYKEYVLKEKMRIIGNEDVNTLDIRAFIKEYRDRLRKKQEIHNNIISIERAYSTLIKDRDINKIREELKDIIKLESPYSYESEEEIEREEKEKSKKLIQYEKEIKDIENKINTRFIGKRNLVEIDEEIQDINEKMDKSEKQLRAVRLAMDTLQESMDDVRKEVGPALNKSVADIFSKLTKGKYEEVKLDKNYEMMVRNSVDLFKGNYLSNGAYDQLYLSLRIALIELLFSEEEHLLILDDAFVQYDNKRREEALLVLKERIIGQLLIFTCHTNERNIMLKNNIEVNYIEI